MNKIKALYIGSFWPATPEVVARLEAGLRRYQDVTIILEKPLSLSDMRKRQDVFLKMARRHPHARIIFFDGHEKKTSEEWQIWYSYVARLTHQVNIFYTDSLNPQFLKRSLDCAQGLWE